MDTQRRSTFRLATVTLILCTVWCGTFSVGQAEAASANLLTGPVRPPVSKTKQVADQFVAATKSGYYKALLIPDWRVKQSGSVRDQAVALKLWRTACPQTAPAAQPIQLDGERLDEAQVKLTWKTTGDIISDNLSIERSLTPTDGFETVAFINGVTDQTVDPNTYAQYTYYRLKRVDLNDAYSYSPTVAVKGELPALSLKAYPNPAQQKNLMFRVGGLAAASSLSVALYDVQGRILYQQEQAVPDGDGRFTLPGLSSLQPGNYYIRIITKDRHASTSFILQQ